MPGQYVVSPNGPPWLVVVVLGLKVVKAGSKDVSGLNVVVVVVVLGLIVVVVGRADVVLLGEASSSMQPTKGSPVLPAWQKHSSPLSVTFWQET